MLVRAAEYSSPCPDQPPIEPESAHSSYHRIYPKMKPQGGLTCCYGGWFDVNSGDARVQIAKGRLGLGMW